MFYQNLGDSVKAVVRGTYKIEELYQKEERSKIKYVSFYLGTLEKDDQSKSKLSKRKEIIKNREEIKKLKI